MKLIIRPDGVVQFVHNDRLSAFVKGAKQGVEGQQKLKRASHVEPTEDDRWTADMSPLGVDVKLGPFETRKEALDAEVEWLENNPHLWGR